MMAVYGFWEKGTTEHKVASVESVRMHREELA